MSIVIRTPFSTDSHVGLDAIIANPALVPKISAKQENGNIKLTIEVYINATPATDVSGLPQGVQNELAEKFMNITTDTELYSDGMTVSFSRTADDKANLLLSANVNKKPPSGSGN